jgi:hypothetical protein
VAVPAGGGEGVSRTRAPDLIAKIYEHSEPGTKAKYSSASLADIPDKDVLQKLAEELDRIGNEKKMAWIKSWEGGPDKDMVISIVNDKSGEIVEHSDTADKFPVCIQWKKRGQ